MVQLVQKLELMQTNFQEIVKYDVTQLRKLEQEKKLDEQFKIPKTANRD